MPVNLVWGLMVISSNLPVKVFWSSLAEEYTFNFSS